MRWQSGESGYAIAKSLGGKPTSQGISKRARKEGWAETSSETVSETGVSQQTWLGRCQDMTPVGFKDGPERRANILQCLSEGMSKRAAANYAGISYDALNDWENKDTTLASQIREAEQGWHRRQLKKLDDSSDPKTAMWQLEQHPATREDYVTNSRAPGGNQFQVIVNIDRGSHSPESVDQVILEVE